MSRYFPRAPDAESQPLARTMLTTHVAVRSVQSASLVTMVYTPLSYWARRRRAGAVAAAAPLSTSASASAASAASATSTSASATRPPLRPSTFAPHLMRNLAISVPTGVALGVLATMGRMRGREDIEWRDRAWRLAVNPFQTECDDWTYAGMLLGGLVGAAGGGGALLGRPVVRVAGMLGYVAWRHGVRGGKYSEREL